MKWGRQSTRWWVRLISWDASILFRGTPLSYFLGRLYLISWDAYILFPGTPLSYFLGRPSSIIIHVPTTGWPDLAELLFTKVEQHAIIVICINAWSEPEDHMLMMVSVVDTFAGHLSNKHRWTTISIHLGKNEYIALLYVTPIDFNCMKYTLYITCYWE